MSSGSFATAINCIDGRIQLPVIAYIQKKARVQHVDMITEPGTIKFFADAIGKSVVTVIRQAVEISVEGHHSKNVFIVAHHNCLGNPVSEEIQKKELIKALAEIRSWGFPIKAYGLWVNAGRQVEEFPGT